MAIAVCGTSTYMNSLSRWAMFELASHGLASLSSLLLIAAAQRQPGICRLIDIRDRHSEHSQHTHAPKRLNATFLVDALRALYLKLLRTHCRGPAFCMA